MWEATFGRRPTRYVIIEEAKANGDPLFIVCFGARVLAYSDSLDEAKQYITAKIEEEGVI